MTRTQRVSHISGASRGYNWPFYFKNSTSKATVFAKQAGEKVVGGTGDWVI